MKRKFQILILTLILIIGCTSLGAFASDDAKTLDIMFLHDLHSHLNEFNTVENGESVTLGGFAKIKTLINEQKAINPDTLLFDAGDFSMGTLIQAVYEDEAAELRMLGDLGIDVTTFGNHEYDYNAKGLSNMLDSALNSGDVLPQIAVSNVDWSTMEAVELTEDQQLLKEAFNRFGIQEYVMLEKDGIKIAVMGLFGMDCLACVPNCPLTFGDPVEFAKATVEKIKTNENADLIVCVSHGGVWSDSDKSEDEILAKSVPEIDVIVSGHTHTKLEEPIVHGDTYIVSVGEYGKYLGNMSLTQKENGRWNLEMYDLLVVDESVEPDVKTQEKVDALMSMVDSRYLAQFGYTKDQVLTFNDVEFDDSSKLSSTHTEQPLGSLMADAYDYAVEKYDTADTHPVDVAVVPSGTVRDTYALGNITVENVFNSFSLGIGADGVPGYPLISIYLTGAELKTAAEIDASISDIMSTARLYTNGLYWNYNPNRMILNKVTDVYLTIDGTRAELEDDKLYRVVTDFYTSQMLGGVTDLSFGLLSIVPKFADGTPVENYEDAIVMNGDQELKAWVAIADYMDNFEDTDGDGVGEVPANYGGMEGRKVVEDSKSIGDLLKNPNKFFFMILAVVLVVIAILAVIVVVIVKVVKRIVRRRMKK